MVSQASTGTFSTLVLGWGCDLRSDDAAGLHLATAVSEQDWDNVDTRIIPQLTPDMAFDLSEFDQVIFVDAVQAKEGSQIIVKSIEPQICGGLNEPIGHSASPLALLTLSHTLYETNPKAWIVGIPAVNFSIGEDVSETTQAGIQEGLREIKKMLTQIPYNTRYEHSIN